MEQEYEMTVEKRVGGDSGEVRCWRSRCWRLKEKSLMIEERD